MKRRDLLFMLLGVVLAVVAYAIQDTALTVRDLRIKNATQDVQIMKLTAEITKIESFLSGGH